MYTPFADLSVLPAMKKPYGGCGRGAGERAEAGARLA